MTRLSDSNPWSMVAFLQGQYHRRRDCEGFRCICRWPLQVGFWFSTLRAAYIRHAEPQAALADPDSPRALYHVREPSMHNFVVVGQPLREACHAVCTPQRYPTHSHGAYVSQEWSLWLADAIFAG